MKSERKRFVEKIIALALAFAVTFGLFYFVGITGGTEVSADGTPNKTAILDTSSSTRFTAPIKTFLLFP